MPTPYSGIGPRWLAWLMILFAGLEVPWLIYLALFQVRTGTAYHTHLAALGMTVATVAASVTAAVGLWRGKRWTPVAATMAATMFLAGGVLTSLVSVLNPLWIAVPGMAAALTASYRTLRLGRSGPTVDRWLAAALALVAAGLVIRLATMFTSTATEVPANHLRALVVLLDTGEVIALAGAGLGLLRRQPRIAIFFGSAGIVLFSGDAWANIVLVPPGPAFTAALFYAVVGELPSTVMCIAAVALSLRIWRAGGGTRADSQEVLLP
ncbi:MAG: hypothetical protein R2720_14300 [Candidatus Nanopelagicales bacterium]